jgi:hypothetical protein
MSRNALCALCPAIHILPDVSQWLGRVEFTRNAFENSAVRLNINEVNVFAGMIANGQHELLYALHYMFLNVEPPKYKKSEKTFYCVPELSLPEGGFSPMLPFCVLISKAGEPTGTRNQLDDMMAGKHGPAATKVATFLEKLADSNLEMGLHLDRKTYSLNNKCKLLLSGAAILHRILQDPRLQPTDISSINTVCCRSSSLLTFACTHALFCVKIHFTPCFPNHACAHVCFCVNMYSIACFPTFAHCNSDLHLIHRYQPFR